MAKIKKEAVNYVSNNKVILLTALVTGIIFVVAGIGFMDTLKFETGMVKNYSI